MTFLFLVDAVLYELGKVRRKFRVHGPRCELAEIPIWVPDEAVSRTFMSLSWEVDEVVEAGPTPGGGINALPYL